MDATAISIKCFASLEPDLRQKAEDDIERIFFESSKTQSFENAAVRQLFRDTWLSPYLDTFPDLMFVAYTDGAFIGYVTACDRVPAGDASIDGQIYPSVFSDLWSSFPGHLHINVSANSRSHGVGARLISTAVEALKDRGTGGVHVVTGDGGRNMSFYRTHAFTHEIRRSCDGKKLLFMGRSL